MILVSLKFRFINVVKKFPSNAYVLLPCWSGSKGSGCIIIPVIVRLFYIHTHIIGIPELFVDAPL